MLLCHFRQHQVVWTMRLSRYGYTVATNSQLLVGVATIVEVCDSIPGYSCAMFFVSTAFKLSEEEDTRQ